MERSVHQIAKMSHRQSARSACGAVCISHRKLILGVDSRVHTQRANRMATTILSLCLGALGIIGTTVLITSTGMVMWHYRGARIWSFRWQWRNWRLLQISAIATFFFMAMTASYGILDQPWAWLYLIIACKTGTWWLRCAINRRA